MKQPKDDDRYEVNNPHITKGQHIIPANIIKKWKQKDKDGRLKLLTQIKFTPKSDPKIQWFSDERMDDFCVYHRWSQSFEVYANEVVEQPFFKLIDELEKDERDIIKFDFIKDRQTLTIINYDELIKRRIYYKFNNSNVDCEAVVTKNFTQEEQEELEYNHIGYIANNKMIGLEWLGYWGKCLYHEKSAERGTRKSKEHHDWFYIRIHDKTSRFVLPDNWDDLQIVSVSPHSILISQYSINVLGQEIDLNKLDINNPNCKDVVSFVDIINKIALFVYDKWLIR
ncbi:MAG: hypothetical protein IJT14_02660 [Rickettsiales bacterium]|nr:hypothetical protein [Rickettsiales bacterium]